MIRLTRKVFTDLTIWMIGLGLLMGVVFPFFVTLMGIPTRAVLTPWFFAACMAAGLIVGAVNIRLARVVVGRRLQVLAERMRHVAANLEDIAGGGDLSRCRPADCLLKVDSDDEIGESAQAFNHLVQALAFSLQTEAAVRVFTEMLASQLEVSDLTDRALQQLLQHTQAGAGAILVETEGEVKVAVSHGIRSPDTIAASDYVRFALRTEKRYSVLLPKDLIMEGVLTDFRPREVLIDPILHKEVVLGAIVLASGSGFTTEDRNRLDLFRQGLALALHNALLYDRLERLAALDSLTGIYNRRFGMARLHEEFGRALRTTAPLGVLMFDLDHFKQVNDTYGHLAGDRVLIRVAKLARSVMRDGDIIVRYGGEEFLAILPGASRNDLRQVGERLRRMIEDTALADGEQVIRVTVSIGGSAYPEVDVDDETMLVKQADKALYAAKESGRNRVMLV
jgi:two-component system cell cycle response regulator